MQPVADDRLHAALAIGAARLLVGENVLERHHLAGERGEILLGRVDDRQPLVEMRERLAWCAPPGRLRPRPMRWLTWSSRSSRVRVRWACAPCDWSAKWRRLPAISASRYSSSEARRMASQRLDLPAQPLGPPRKDDGQDKENERKAAAPRARRSRSVTGVLSRSGEGRGRAAWRDARRDSRKEAWPVHTQRSMDGPLTRTTRDGDRSRTGQLAHKQGIAY